MNKILILVMTIMTLFLLDFPIAEASEGDLTFRIEGRPRVYQGVTYGKYLSVYQEGRRIYHKNYEKIRPWAIDIGDLENDGILDIYIGAYRATDYYPLDKRPFFFEWRDGMYQKWTGSYMSPFELIDLRVDGNKVITKEYNKDKYYQATYMWQHFAFVQINLEEL